MTSILAAVDAMGGDAGVAASVPAAVRALDELHALDGVILVGDEASIQDQLRAINPPSSALSRIDILHAPYSIGMDEQPATVIRKRSDSSMLRSIELAAGGKASFCVSAGNTGALVGLARRSCGLLPGVRKLAICAHLPTKTGNTFLLDVGATVDCTAQNLQQFALMGSALVESLGFAKTSRVKCLSIGAEAGKGNRLVKKASKLLEQDPSLAYKGLVEADALFAGTCEVVVCDGFAGNIALKSSEGTARYIRAHLKHWAAQAGVETGDQHAEQPFANLMQAIDPAQFNGACLLGLDTLVIKSHGGANSEALLAAMAKGVTAAGNNLVQRVARRLAEQFER